MNEEIKKIIDEKLTEDYLTEEATNRFYDYLDDEDLEEDESHLDCILRYGAEEIPYDLIQEVYLNIKQKTGIDIYESRLDDVQNYIKEKIRVVYPFFGAFQDAMMKRLDDIGKLTEGWTT